MFDFSIDYESVMRSRDRIIVTGSDCFKFNVTIVCLIMRIVDIKVPFTIIPINYQFRLSGFL